VEIGVQAVASTTFSRREGSPLASTPLGAEARVGASAGRA
jgi:hypothetical protein